MPRKPRRPVRRQLKRKSKTREPYDRVLIVTEGEKTEPFYLRELVNNYRLSTANIEVIGAGAGPDTVVERAKELRNRERQRGEKFDQVYCVFDRNRHPGFAGASSRARHLGLRLARSWPCFEYWLLLHFEYVRKPFTGSGKQSDCDNCVRVLRQHIAGYAKATPGVFRLLKNKIESAKERARRARADARSTGADDPSTEMHDLVEYLQYIKNP